MRMCCYFWTCNRL